jgi:hypothetical protein
VWSSFSFRPQCHYTPPPIFIPLHLMAGLF